MQLIDARQSFTKMRKSLGEKRKEVSADQIADIVRLYGNFDQQLTDDDEQLVKIFPNEESGFLRITVERPLRLKWEAPTRPWTCWRVDKKLAKLDDQQRQALAEHARGRVGRDDVPTVEAAARKEGEALDGRPAPSTASRSRTPSSMP